MSMIFGRALVKRNFGINRFSEDLLPEIKDTDSIEGFSDENFYKKPGIREQISIVVGARMMWTL